MRRFCAAGRKIASASAQQLRLAVQLFGFAREKLRLDDQPARVELSEMRLRG